MATNSHLALVPTLIADFAVFLSEFEARVPFKKADQLESHRRTIALRQSLGTAAAAIADPEFVASLHWTLRAWGIGSRASKLRPLPDFSAALRTATAAICALEAFRIDAESNDADGIAGEIWRVIERLDIVENATPLVSGTKALHHLLPDLVPPMDRGYTQPFFRWHNPQFQYQQSKCFKTAFGGFAQIAREVHPAQYVGRHSWHTSRTKVLDNAVVGFIEVMLAAAREAQVPEQ